MNLYELHEAGTSLELHREAHVSVTELFWSKIIHACEVYQNKKMSYAFPALGLNEADEAALEEAEATFKLQVEQFSCHIPAISQSAPHAYNFALRCVRGRFQIGEAAIATSAWFARQYAEHVLKGRFQLGEAAIATEAVGAAEYAATVIKGRFPLAEQTLRTFITECDSGLRSAGWPSFGVRAYFNKYPEALKTA